MSRQKAKAVARRESHYQPAWMMAPLVLAAAALLAWHGMARAETSDPAAPPVQSAQAASPEDAAPNPACTDAMDFAPEENESSPFDADTVAQRFIARTGHAHALKVLYGACQDDSQRLSES